MVPSDELTGITPLVIIGVRIEPDLMPETGRVLLFPDSKVYVANMGPIWGRQDPGGPHVGPMNFAIWVILFILKLHVNDMRLK